ncbi:2-hydroxyhepta-2,4-diene-1,7-dioate isomerase [Brevibacillus panacihumi W25]|uniref:2-hydroxyhepta-2,4-diene-1,7-dioate isomerase n=1 Tax=Brevibacillus panacihumi W25 TaxID=1408254 RepID=V6MAJ6_9BACL|nr:fumarylacetoacetate hydrolase family protein [Brevibacillus panacihumi]EST55571.1 2-hydroxyhepta-2,4-diene-1,7-dioate isomerase [Brevibacillus panacihumi W25]
MKFALFNDFQLGVVIEDNVYEIGALMADGKPAHSCPMVDLIHRYEHVKETIAKHVLNMPSHSLADVRLRHPVSRPGKIVAAPVNYLAHKKEMKVENTARGLGFFLKANTSLIGPEDPIVLPESKEGRRFDHELELAFVIGKTAKNVKAEQAYDYIFGYTGLNDVTLRPDEQNEEERCLRKSFDTFTPMGPWIVTPEDIKDPQQLDMVLTVNGEERQKVNGKDMICGIAELVELFSHVMTLEPGDIIATGTPDGVAPIKQGDVITISIDQIGSFSNPVVSESVKGEMRHDG